MYETWEKESKIHPAHNPHFRKEPPCLVRILSAASVIATNG